MNWIEQVVQARNEVESPQNFWKWSAIATISAVVKDNVWMNRQLYLLYPNIYVMFHAESGLKKGPPVNMAKHLVKMVNNTRVISGRSSIQGILKELATAYSKPGGEVIKKAVAFICSSELSSSIVEDKVATTILTDLYDRSYNVGEWRSLLKMESFDLKDPTVTMLTATNEAHSGSFFENKDIRGGYFARTFIIYESEENTINSLLAPLETPINLGKDAEYLKKLSVLKGEFKSLAKLAHDEEYRYKFVQPKTNKIFYCNEAGALYEQWYRDFRVAAKEAKDPTGTLNRFGDSVLKVAMLFSLAREPDLIISSLAMQEAIDTCEKLIGNVRRVTLGKEDEKATDGLRKVLLIQELLQREDHSISRLGLNKKYWLQGNIDEWDKVCLSMNEAGFMNIDTVGNQIIYRMKENVLNEMQDYLKGKIR